MEQKPILRAGITKLNLAHYMRAYEYYLSEYKEREMVLLELGIAYGDSLLHWRNQFPKGRIVGLDICPVELDDPSGCIVTYQGEQQDRTLLDRIAAETAPGGFDVIIDDASHIGQYTRISFWHLFRNHLKPGGLYFIEDWGTSYWNTFPDGKSYSPKPVDFAWYEKIMNFLVHSPLARKSETIRRIFNKLRRMMVKRVIPSHQHGMIGFVKELVDECGAPDMTDDRFTKGPKRASLIEWMRISVGHVIVKKAGPRGYSER